MTIETARQLIPAGYHEEMWKLLELDLTRDSLAVMIGSYTGLTVHIVSEAYGCRMMCYDPQKFACETLRDMHLDNVEVFQYGLGREAGTFPMWELGNDACSFYPGNSERHPGEGQMRDASTVLQDLDIDFLFMNCEGSEFDILDRLYETGHINHVKHIMVQFHKAAANGNDYEAHLDRIKKDYEVVWTLGAPWTLLARHDNVERSEDRPPCPECGFTPDPDKDYKRSMTGHKRVHLD